MHQSEQYSDNSLSVCISQNSTLTILSPLLRSIGSLSCTADCVFDTSRCHPLAVSCLPNIVNLVQYFIQQQCVWKECGLFVRTNAFFSYPLTNFRDYQIVYQIMRKLLLKVCKPFHRKVLRKYIKCIINIHLFLDRHFLISYPGTSVLM